MWDALMDAVRAHAAATPTRIAIARGDTTLSYHDLLEAVHVRAARFAGAGIGPGTRVSLRIDNTPDGIVTLLAAAERGATPLLVANTATPSETARAEGLFGAQLTVVDGTPVGHVSAAPGPDAVPALCLTTSGTTGLPKVLALDWPTTLHIAQNFVQTCGLTGDDTVLGTTPITHSYGLCVGVFGSLCTGSTLALCPPPVTAGSIYASVRAHDVTVIQSVPFYYKLLLSCPSDALARVRLCISGGEVLSSALRRDWRACFRSVLANHYGASEIGQVGLEVDDVMGSIGRPIGGCEAAIREPFDASEGDDASKARCGRIWIRAIGRPCRYLAPEPVPGDPSHAGGWFDTGDLGFIDETGRLIVTGRTTARIFVGGRKVDPVEVEQAIRAYPGVTDCAVVGRRGAGDEERVCAFVQAETIDAAALRAFLRTQLSEYKLPASITSIDAVPRTATGKIRYGLLAQAGAR
jgi:acyl-CoA synthetase (AMP-forming)/AMP-acid ligase II